MVKGRQWGHTFPSKRVAYRKCLCNEVLLVLNGLFCCIFQNSRVLFGDIHFKVKCSSSMSEVNIAPNRQDNWAIQKVKGRYTFSRWEACASAWLSYIVASVSWILCQTFSLACGKGKAVRTFISYQKSGLLQNIYCVIENVSVIQCWWWTDFFPIENFFTNPFKKLN